MIIDRTSCWTAPESCQSGQEQTVGMHRKESLAGEKSTLGNGKNLEQKMGTEQTDRVGGRRKSAVLSQQSGKEQTAGVRRKRSVVGVN